VSGQEATALLQRLHAEKTKARNESKELRRLIDAAKAVVVLSEWTTMKDGERVYRSSMFAVEALRQTIEDYENPVLRLAPEPLPMRIV
jgi:hypothetical protein